MSEKSLVWYDHRQHLVAWLVFLFPVGLFGLWKTSLWNDRDKIRIAIGVIIAVTVIAALGRNGQWLFALLACPAALWYLWQDERTTQNIRYLFATILAAYILVLLGTNDAASTSGYSPSSGCSATFERNGCTYYRDSSCNVIGRSCN